MAVRSIGMVDPARYMNATLDFSQKTRYTQPVSNIFSYDKSLSNMIENNNNVYVPTPHIAETSPRGDSDVRRGCPNPQHAGEARGNPNCAAEAKN